MESKLELQVFAGFFRHPVDSTPFSGYFNALMKSASDSMIFAGSLLVTERVTPVFVKEVRQAGS